MTYPTSSDWQNLLQSILENKESIKEMRKTQREAMAELRKEMKDTDYRMKETAKLMKDTDCQMKETAKLMKETDERMKETDERMKETDERIKETDQQIKETSLQMKKTDKQLKETDRKLEKLGMLHGNHVNNVGDVTEDFFFRGLFRKKELGNIKFDIVKRNVGEKKEYDILMVNGDIVVVISVKYKLHEKDIDKFIKKDLDVFKAYCPEFKKYKVYAGIASKFITENLEKKMNSLGIFAISQSGKGIKILNENTLKIQNF